MPIFDLKCDSCGDIQYDRYEQIVVAERPLCACGGSFERVWLPGRANAVHGDECDIWIKHGICNEDGTPRRYTSRSDMKKEADRRGLRLREFRHIPRPGSDKSPHSTRWT